MDPLTLTLLIVGGVALAILLLSVVVGDLDLGGPDADGPFSLPAIAAFAGGVGFAGAIVAALLPEDLGALRVLIAVGAGILAALPLTWATLRFMAALTRMPTDETVSEQHLLGRHGVVISAIPAGGLGEVRLSLAGQQLKFNARSDKPLPSGTPVYVIGTPTPTSVDVVSTAPDEN